MHDNNYDQTDDAWDDHNTWANDNQLDNVFESPRTGPIGGSRDPLRKKPSGCGCSPLAMIALICSSVAMVTCCGGGYFLVNLGIDQIAHDVEIQVRDNDKFREHIGEPEPFEINWEGSFGDDDSFVFDVKGTKGSGELTVWTIDLEDGATQVVRAQLRLKSGETIDLEIDDPTAEAQENGEPH